MQCAQEGDTCLHAACRGKNKLNSYCTKFLLYEGNKLIQEAKELLHIQNKASACIRVCVYVCVYMCTCVCEPRSSYTDRTR